MEVKLYTNYSENFVIGKSISLLETVQCTIKDSLSVEKPILRLQYSGNIKKVNYVYIEELKRYYFVKEKYTLTGERYELHCDIDVLESFKDSILSLLCIVDKQENNNLSNMYLNDGSFVTLSKQFNRVVTFPNGFNDEGTYILICAGGEGNE